jgi:hypothetical protein
MRIAGQAISVQYPIMPFGHALPTIDLKNKRSMASVSRQRE